jgi:hypothetical protein
MKPPKTRSERVKDRAELEKQFLSSALADIDNFGDLGGLAGRYPGITWRHFHDRRHQTLWRALTTLDLAIDSLEIDKTLNKRVDELVTGLPPEEREDLADNRGAWKELFARAQGGAWLEHELEAAGALALVGGKAYLREVLRFYLYEPEGAKEKREWAAAMREIREAGEFPGLARISERFFARKLRFI